MIYNTSKRFLPIYKSGPTGPDFQNLPLTYKALANGSNYVQLSGSSTSWQYKVNDGDWTAYTNNAQINLASGDTVSFSGSSNCPLTSKVAGNIEIYGNLSSIIGYADSLKVDKQLCKMFSGQTGIVHTSSLIIPFLSSTAPSGMRQMFTDCKNLITAPVISTTTWGNHGCAAMFSGCTSLLHAPTFNWSVLTNNYTFQKVFQGCTALRSAKIVGNATTKSGDDYRSFLLQFTNATVQFVLVEWLSWPDFSNNNTNPFLDGISTNNTYGIFVGPTNLSNTKVPSNWNRISKDSNGVMTLTRVNRSDYSSKLNSIVTNIVWNDSTSHYDLVFAD